MIHETVDAITATNRQRTALHALRKGERLTEATWRSRFGMQRLAATVEVLRNAHGFDILGDGKPKKPYWMKDRMQGPRRVKCTGAMKEAYYETDHWRRVRQERLERDGFACVLCGSGDNLQVHHCWYALFAEQFYHLITLCREDHERVHGAAKLAFPTGLTPEHARRLGFEPQWEEWLLPPKPAAGRLFADMHEEPF